MHFSIFFLFLIFYLPVPVKAEYFYYNCGDGIDVANYTTNSTYQSSLNQLLSALRSNSTTSSFAAGTVGTVPDQVTGIAMCRGDLNASACSTCLSLASENILSLCPYYKTALMWYNSCYMYFSSRYFLSSKANKPNLPLINVNNITDDDATRYGEAVLELMSEMKSWAVNNSTKFFATGIATNFSTEWPIFYGLVQCTPDLNKVQCQDCLQELFNYFPQYYDGDQSVLRHIAGRTIGIRCNMRYEVASFYDGPAMVQIDSIVSSQGTGTRTGSGSKKKNNAIDFAIAIPVVAAVLSFVIFCFCLYKKRSQGRNWSLSERVNSQQNMELVDSLLIDFSTLKAATLNFHESNKLGEGGFGAVFKGILPSGEEVAVKRLSHSSDQGSKELINELVLVAKLQHKNLVRVIGICLEKQEKLLVYEFVPNRSLDTILFDNEMRQELDWRRRQRL